MAYVDDQYSILPDGSYFKFWDIETKFTKTYYVSKAADACDSNPGTKDAPFATISKAAEVLMPGERVEIGGGVYDEFVRPAHGGTGPDAMISYEAAPGERVVLTGAKLYKNGFVEASLWNTRGLGKYYNYREDFDADANCYAGFFERDDFDKINPFSQVNCASQAFGGCEFWFHYTPNEADWQPFLKRRGLIMVDGIPLKQVNYCNQLSQVPGSYWVEDSGYTFVIRLEDDGDPADHEITYTCRDQLFSPKKEYTGYIRVKGLEFEYVGNGCPGSQKGALSVNGGSHWIIEENKVRWANGVGIDIGNQTSQRRRPDTPIASQIVRNNHISYCGVCGLAGAGGGNEPLIERNVFDNNCWHDIEFNWESGAMKIHGVRNGLIRYNVVTNNWYGSALWTDFANANSRICYNVVLDCKSMIMGTIFVEASDVPNRVDHNVVWKGFGNHLGTLPQRTSGGGHGIYQHDSDFLVIDNNILLGLEGAGVFLNYGDPIRICNGHGPIGNFHEIKSNIIADCGRAYVMPNEKNFADGNVLGYRTFGSYAIGIERLNEVYEMLDMRSARMFHDWEKNGKMCEIKYDIKPEEMRLNMTFQVLDDVLEQSYDLWQPIDIDPVFEFLNARDCSWYDAMRFFAPPPRSN